MKTISKITAGFVTQTFDEAGQLIDQSFLAGDDVRWEDQYGESLENDAGEDYYAPFDMVQ